MIEFSCFEEDCISLVKNSRPKLRGRHSILHSITHLKRARKLVGVDNEMAAFRGLTAVEEAATGIFYTLQDKKYPGAEKINPKSHIHKNAIAPFLQMLIYFYEEYPIFKEMKPRFRLEDEKRNKILKIVFSITVEDKELWAAPIPPLDFFVTVNEQRPDYQEELKRILKEQNQNNLLEYVRQEANKRNQILYAAPQGAPHVDSISKDFFVRRKAIVMSMVYAYLLIAPYTTHQGFVQDALSAFLKSLSILDKKFQGEI